MSMLLNLSTQACNDLMWGLTHRLASPHGNAAWIWCANACMFLQCIAMWRHMIGDVHKDAVSPLE